MISSFLPLLVFKPEVGKEVEKSKMAKLLDKRRVPLSTNMFLTNIHI